MRIYATVLLSPQFWLLSLADRIFDDTSLFQVNWPGNVEPPGDLMQRYDENLLTEDEAILMTSSDNEQYLCSLPNMDSEDQEIDVNYRGATPRELLQPLYQQRSCTYRIEMFWTYELCHGRYLLQYHEEKDATRRTKRQEYYLGQYIADSVTEDEVHFDHLKPPRRKIEDQMLPYYPVRYIQGTVCDITNKPRVTEVHYVCLPDSKNQIYSFDEVSSCEYELVVLTPRLCAHPAFQVEDNPTHFVGCYPVDGSPPRPAALAAWEREQQWDSKQYHKRIIIGNKERAQDAAPPPKPTPEPPRPLPTDSALIASFLAGDYCLYGGAGWWKHEYCHGRQVIQFHEEPDTGVRTEIILGHWNEAEHLAWIGTKPHKAPLKVDGAVRQVSHFYTGGDLCELTKSKRSVEVRLRCRETAGNSNAVTLYLLEPKPCEYILGVESQMFCDLLQETDDKGLLKKA